MTSHQRKKDRNYKRDQVEILEFKSMITKMKNLLEGINRKSETPKETISKLKNRSTEIIHPEQQRDKRMKKNKVSDKFGIPLRTLTYT